MDVTVRSATLRSGLVMPYAETGDSGGVPVVLVHAYAESRRYFDGMLARLPAWLHGYAPTQRGHGDAGRPTDGYRLEDFADDVVDVLDAVGVGRAVLVGTSSGGLVAQSVASTVPDRVTALVLVSSPATLADKPGVAAVRQAVDALSDPVDRDFVDGFVRSTSPESLPDDVVRLLVDESLEVPARVWRETLRGLVEADLPVALDRISAPTLLISGDQDAIVGSDQEVLRRGIPHAELIVYEGVGHAVHLAHPDRVVADLVTFLDARP